MWVKRWAREGVERWLSEGGGRGDVENTGVVREANKRERESVRENVPAPKGILRNTSPGNNVMDRKRSKERKRVRFQSVRSERGSGLYFREERTDYEWWLLEAMGERRVLFGECKGLRFGVKVKEVGVDRNDFEAGACLHRLGNSVGR